MNDRLVIIDGVRTPFSKMGTDLAALAADELGRIAVNALLTRTGLDPAIIDEVIFGCVGQPADAANVARVIALRAGIPKSVPAITVHRNCASGCEAITQAQEKIIAGRGSIFVVGGTESWKEDDQNEQPGKCAHREVPSWWGDEHNRQQAMKQESRSPRGGLSPSPPQSPATASKTAGIGTKR